jgi:adenylosuccinate lyase
MENICISPLDDRYKSKTEVLKPYFSEYALFKYRLLVEIKYIVSLCRLKLPELDVTESGFTVDQVDDLLLNMYSDYDYDDYMEIKRKEQVTKHDVKALEYFIKDKFEKIGLEKHTSFIHFALTSQDINNTSVSYSLKEYIESHHTNVLTDLIKKINNKSDMWKDIVMITRTHGQPAVPSTLGKEFKVFSYRLELQMELLESIKYYGKFGGAVGNLNAHKVAYPDIDWVMFGEKFLDEFNLHRSKFTTQIDNYDNLSVVFDNLKRINTILIDLCQDIWLYISMDYIKQQIIKGEVGSSTMPHKVNPINFENAEGNLKIANSLLEMFSRKLPVSRLQRDLTDSTVLRNIGVVFGYILVAISNLNAGLDKLDVNHTKIKQDLEDNYVVISEGIQTILRKHGQANAYEQLKDFTRQNKKVTKEIMNEFINSLDVDQAIKIELLSIDVHSYI